MIPESRVSEQFGALVTEASDTGIWARLFSIPGEGRVIALLVGIMRMYVGAHYPQDVLAGAILGSAWGLLGGSSMAIQREAGSAAALPGAAE